MRLLDPATVREHLGLPPDPEADAALREGRLPGRDPFLQAALAWAQREHPEAAPLDQAAFAALVAYLTTGFYGGYGTEEYERERQAEDLILAFAGGMPPAPGSVVAITPPLDAAGSPRLPLPPVEWTRQALRLLVIALLGRGPRAAADEAAILLQRTAGPLERLGPAREGVLRVVERYWPHGQRPREL